MSPNPSPSKPIPLGMLLTTWAECSCGWTGHECAGLDSSERLSLSEGQQHVRNVDSQPANHVITMKQTQTVKGEPLSEADMVPTFLRPQI